MNNSFIIKVCGMRDGENIRQAENLGIDLMGFIFWPRSSRFVTVRPSYLPTLCRRVGVFVDAPFSLVRQTAADYGLHYVQLHGNESPDYCAQLQDLRIIKAFNIATPDDLALTAAYEGLADTFLFDAKGKSVGGNGQKFNWDVLQHYTGHTPFLLSGGIGPDDASLLASLSHPRCIGIDLNSCFESAPGVKDIQKLKTFIQTLQS